jgi:membrane fusion protein, multidrug efflux system
MVSGGVCFAAHPGALAVDKNVGIIAMSREGQNTLIWILALLVEVSAGCDGSSVASNASRSGPPVADKSAVSSPPASAADPVVRTAVSVQPGDAGEILTVLSVEHQVDLSTELDGIVVAIAKDEGNAVKAGEILAKLDDRALKLELIKARDDLQVSQNNVLYKEAESKSKRASFDRQRQLRQYGLSSQADLEAAEFAAKAAEFDLHGWQAQAEASQAEINRIELMLDKMCLRAPFAGVVARRYIRQGQTLAKNDRCFRVSQLAPLQVQFQVSEASGRRPELGALVEVSLLGNPGLPLAARIVKIGPTVDPASDSYNVTAQLRETRASTLLPGMAVRVAWPTPGHVTP